MGELVSATESVSPIWALLFPFMPVIILMGFYFAAGGGFMMMTMMILVEVNE